MIEAMRALAEPRRLEILQVLVGQELAAGQIADQFDVTRTAISQHITVLKKAGLLNERREGTKRLYSVRAKGFNDVREFLEQFWTERLERLDSFIQEENKRIN